MIAITLITAPAELRYNHYGQAFDLGTGLTSGLSGKEWRLRRIKIHYQDPLSGSGYAKVWLHFIPNHFTVVLEKSKNFSNIKTAAFQSMSFLSAGCMLAGPFTWAEGQAGFSLSSFPNLQCCESSRGLGQGTREARNISCHALVTTRSYWLNEKAGIGMLTSGVRFGANDFTAQPDFSWYSGHTRTTHHCCDNYS